MDTANYFDLQVNGYAGVDFNQDDLTAEDLHLACERLAADGASILATFVTEDIGKMAHRLAKVVMLRERDALVQKVVIGFHVEGPFINEIDGYRGAHPLDAVRPANIDDMEQLLEAGAGLTQLVTLAPERDAGLRVTRLLTERGIKVSAGHCNPSLDELKAALDAGLSLFTHLGNGCPMQMHRHDNIIQRALSLSDRLWLCFIADGAHVAFPALDNYLRAASIDRCIVVTDAVAPAGMGPGFYKLGRWEIHIGDDMVARAPDGTHLLGAAITMPQTVNNLRHKIGLTEDKALRLVNHNPRQAMGLG